MMGCKASGTTQEASCWGLCGTFVITCCKRDLLKAGRMYNITAYMQLFKGSACASGCASNAR
jgi:hypothetical protein